MAVLKIIDGKICISVDGLASAMGEDRMSAMNVIWTGIKRNKQHNRTTYQHYTDPSDARKRWIIVDSLPKGPHAKVLLCYGDIQAYYLYEQVIDDINMSIDPADGVWYVMQRIDEKMATILTRGCAWMRLISSQRHTADIYPTLEARYNAYLAMLTKDTGHNIHVTHWRSLRRRVVAWDTEGRASMISKKTDNTNSLKLTDMGRTYIINSYAQPIKPSIRDVHRLYNAMAQQKGWATLSEERVRQIIQDPTHKQVIALARHGHNYTANQYERTIKRKKPSFADALWTLDGFTIQLRYKHDGKICSDLYCIAVMDVYSRCVIGYAIGTAETSILVQQAIRQTVRQTMKCPYQMQYDNSSANKSGEATELMQRISRWAFPTAPYNGKSKAIEALIGQIEGHHMRHMTNFKGGNITSHSMDIKANPEFLNSQDLPSMDTVIDQVKLIIDIYNHTQGQDAVTPTDRYNMIDSRRREMDYLSMVQAFYVTRRDRARYTKDGLTIEVHKQRYTYEVADASGQEDMAFRLQYLGESFTVKYDPDDTTMISLWIDGRYIADATIKREAPMAIVDMQPGDRTYINGALEQRRAYMHKLRAMADTNRDTLEQAGIASELSHYILHKDAYNRIEQKLIDQDIDMKALEIAGVPARTKNRKTTLYGDEEGSMRIIDLG